jgi:hypothetical protein
MERAICTIITKNYLVFARTLAETLHKYNPDYILYVLIVEPVDEYFDPHIEKFKCIYLENLSDFDTITKMCFYYTPFELCNGLRGFLHEYMFNQTSHQNWLYLDSDIAIYASLEEIFEALEKTSILLIPHSQSPTPQEFIELYELNHIIEGVYNSGFLGLSRTETTQRFISWFKDRLSKYSFDDRSQGIARALFVDQPWLNLVPIYFSDTNLLLTPGANLAHWNLYRSVLTKDQFGRIKVNQEKLLFVHYSGFEIDKPNQVSKYSHLYNDDNTSPVWIELAQNYQSMLYKNGYTETINFPYKYNYFSNRTTINPQMRRLYYEELKKTNYLENPFQHHRYFKNRMKQEKIMKIFNLAKNFLLTTNYNS